MTDSGKFVTVLFLLLGTTAWNAVCASEPILGTSDRLAIVGGTFVERMQQHGVVEAELQCRRPGWRLSIRNLGWSGDNVFGIARKVFEEPEEGFERLLRDLESVDPTVVMLAYGFAEASDGPEAIEEFERGLQRLAETIAERGPRVVLLKPTAMPGIRVPSYTSGIEECREIVSAVGKQLDLPVIDLKWNPSGTEVTKDGLVPNRQGYAVVADRLADALVGGQPCEQVSEALVRRVREKNQLFFHHYRPQNETYLLLFRKHEQGQNAVEIEQFKPLIEEADRAIWQAADRTSQ